MIKAIFTSGSLAARPNKEVKKMTETEAKCALTLLVKQIISFGTANYDDYRHILDLMADKRIKETPTKRTYSW